jgi:serine/threonine protein kinase
MSYLHGLKVAYRDLKPDNIGFDKDGSLKLFDLGLCKEEKITLQGKDGTYRMTGHTGSRRYMAPEVAKDQPYDKSVDVYSFGMLLWEICALEKPYKGYCSKKHMALVVIGGERPKMDHAHTSHWPAPLQCLMKRCWSSNPEERPSFESITEILDEITNELSIVHPDRTRARSTGSQEDNGNKSPLAHVKKLQRQGLGLRARSLGLKRSNS